MDIDIDGFYGLEGIGPKTIKIVYEKLGIKDLSGLEKAASEGRLRSIHGFSEKKEARPIGTRDLSPSERETKKKKNYRGL